MARVFLPILKEASWPHRALVVSTPLHAHAAAPIVCFAEDLPDGYSFLTREEAPSVDPSALLAEALRNLAARPVELAFLPQDVVACVGQDLSAERILDAAVVAAIHARLGPDIFVSVPHRMALYAIATSAPAETLAQFTRMVRFEGERAPQQGHATVSQLIFHVSSGRIYDAAPLIALEGRQAAAPAPAAASTPAMATRHAPTSASSATRMPRGVRHPSELVLVDAGSTRIEASVVVLGSGAKEFARALHTATGGVSDGPPRAGELEHYVMTLAIMRGWTTQLFLYALDASLESIATAQELAHFANAVVLVQPQDRVTLEPALYPLALAARSGGAQLAFVGPRSALEELTRDSGVHPDVSNHDGVAGAIAVLKEITKHVLASLKRPG